VIPNKLTNFYCISLLQKLAHDLRTTISPVYPDLLSRILKLLPDSISAPTLMTLIATLSALFKYLLIPSNDVGLLETTWLSFREILPKCIPEVQTATAEVWGSALRRMNASAKERSVVLMAQSLEGLEDTTAWMIVFACKVFHFPLFYLSTSTEL
jgi:U3 small nucleolar RNA-associated protein 20